MTNKKIKFIHNKSKGSSRTWKLLAIAIYITFILISTIPFAADKAVQPQMKDSYTYHLTYHTDGRQTHYYVERVDTAKPGKIDLIYTTASNSLVVEAKNIKVLHIFCRSMYEDECQKVYGFNPKDNSNYYKWYFIEKNHFNVNIDADHEIEELMFIDTPFAYEVFVNDIKWTEGVDYFYDENYGTALSKVPSGLTRVDLFFKPPDGTKVPPTALLSASKSLVPVNHTIMFDASQSYDTDGEIKAFIFDFGDGTYRGGSKHTYYYSKAGVYGVLLTVRDNDELVDHAYLNITVVATHDTPDIQGRVPDQEKPEDSPPWSLDLGIYEPIALTEGVQFYWYLTGENTSLYTVSNENNTDDRLIFTPIPDAYGNDLTTLWLKSTENLTVSQALWINITPVNDKPVIYAIPDLVVHYDDPYTFDYEPYVYDKETPRDELTIEVFDGYDKYIIIEGLKVTYIYPQSLIGQKIYATVKVSDGEYTAQDVIFIQVTSDYVPEITLPLPDVWLYEGTTKYKVFDLDDYFTDPDNDAIYFSYGFTHLEITINPNHTVDISAKSEWTGSELVTFRARDPIGAIAEDSIIVTVLPVNDPPTIAGVPDFYIRYDYDFRFDLTPYVHDNDNLTRELTIIVSDPEHIRLDISNNMVIILNYPFEYLGRRETVRLTVFDGLDSAFQDISVAITEDFPPELLTPLPDIVFLEDEPLVSAFDLDNYFLDVDGDVLYYTTGNKFVTISINVDHSVDFSSPRNWFGVEVVYFRATDPTGALQEDLVTVTVLPVNDAPELYPIPAQYGNESERWVLDLEPYIYDVDNNISELKITVDNDFIVISGSTLIFLGSKDLPNFVEVTIDDGEFTASQVIDIYLQQAKRPVTPTLWDLFINILPFLIIILIVIIIISGFIYKKKNKFTVEEVFLIHKGGTLINHLLRRSRANVDDVIFSGMFTAVQEFIRDTFTTDDSQDLDSADNQWALDELKLGKNKILIERSEHTYLAVIFYGDGSKRLRKIVSKLLEEIEIKYANILPRWDGDIRALAGTKEILSVLIEQSTKPKDEPEPIKPPVKPTPILPQPKVAKLQDQSHTPIGVHGKHLTGKPLTMAQPVTQVKKSPQTKELLVCSKEHAKASQPGLTAWPMNNSKQLTFGKMEMSNLPIALHINPQRQLPKTIVINKDQVIIKNKHAPIAKPAPACLDPSKMTKPVKITMPNSGKEFEIDPSKSLLRQLAELDDLEKSMK